MSLTQSEVTVSEDGDEVILTVSRSEPAEGPVSVDFTTVDGTATSPEDFTAVSGTLNFADGETSQSFAVSIISSADVGDEQFSVALSGATDGVPIGIAQSTVTIIDTTDQGELSLTQSALTVNENDSQVSLTVSRSESAEGPVSVNFTTVAGTATSPEDFTAVSGTLNFADGETSQSFIVPIINSADIGDEQFSVELSGATEGVSIDIVQSLSLIHISEPRDRG